MKNIICLFLLTFIATVSCVTNKYYDVTVPKKETAIIRPATVYVNSFNGEDVYWKAMLLTRTAVHIPAGENHLTVGIRNVVRGGMVYSGGKYGFTYDFKPGHTYLLNFNELAFGRYIISVIVDDKTAKTKEVVFAYPSLENEE